MKPLSPSEALNIQRPTSNAQLNRRPRLPLFLLVLLCASVGELHAQVGNNNPSGPSGVFNGLIADGVDPYTGNVRRSITDIAVAGAVGEYPLALVRTYNSRLPSYTSPFGWGGWNHNYNWILENSPNSNTPNFQPARFTVDFPDGRVETFRAVTWDPYYRVRSGADTPAQSTSAGVRERFQPLSYSYCYLILPDGGKIQFHAEQHSYQDWYGHIHYYYRYTATAIIDPYGLTTTLTWQTLDSYWKRLTTVTEPAGRYLQFTYTGPNSLMISRVTEFIGGASRRYVDYYYTQNWADRPYLDHVIYYNNPNWTARYQYQPWNVQNSPFDLLWTADDPMYPGPMKRIAYQYAYDHDAGTCTWAVFGQILRERYWDGVQGHEYNGSTISTLSVCTDGVHNGANYRMETRGDGATRGFIYTTDGYLTSCTDFMGHSASQGYDAYKYINYVIDRNSHRTDYTNDSITGNVTQIKYPLTSGDTPGQTDRPTVNFTYTNNYYLASSQDEAHHTPTAITRDPVSNRITRIDYPDGGYETFSYDSANFYQLQTHRLKTGGTETFAYDTLHRLQYYSDPYHSNPDNFSIRYYYDALGRVNGIFDALWHPTNWNYNDRGQVTVTTLPTDPSDSQRHTITNAYNETGHNAGDGTLISVTDQRGQVTSYTYDDYHRVKSVTPPDRGDGSGLHTTYFYYDANGIGDDYTLTDSNVIWVVLPSGKKTKTVYDDNRRKSSATVAYGTSDAATTSYIYDNVGNVTTVTNPHNQNTSTDYDERNRPKSTRDALNHTTTIEYDIYGRKYRITRPNGQMIMYVSYDAMNRVLRLDATSAGTTLYTYYTPADGQNPPVGLLKTMQDPHLSSGTETYTYTYDLMGRKNTLTYPRPQPTATPRQEQWSYDTVGRLQTFTNRDTPPTKVQTFSYDALNRMTGFSWNDNGLTPSVSFRYDAASRLIEIDNANATIAKAYWNDNSLGAETETATGGVGRTLIYTYDGDGNRATLQIPGYSPFTYTYTNRNQLNQLKSGSTALATYTYDQNGYTGDLTTRSLNNNTSTTYQYDVLDRVTHIAHSLNVRNTRTLDYDYDSIGNRKWTKRDGGTGDVFGYDFNDQVTAVRLNVANPDSTPAGAPTIFYDNSGNRTQFSPYGPIDTYTTNNLNQYSSRNNVNATYDSKGNLTQGFDGSGYTHDAQNRLLTASKGNTTMYFAYDGLNRQVSRRVGANSTPTFSVWDGWNLVSEYHMQSGNAVEDASYLYGATGLVKNLKSGNYYYQDGSGSTSHLASSNGTLLEWYRYDLQGAPVFYNANNTQLSASNYSVRHLFTGQQWYSQVGLYDLRNRFYSPDIGRFLQPDPIGFDGDPTNLYRYCTNNPLKWRDPSGLWGVQPEGYEAPRVWVYASYLGDGPGGSYANVPLGIGFSDPGVGLFRGPFGGFGPLSGLGFGSGWGGTPWRLPENDQVGVENSTPSNVPSQNQGPPSTSTPTSTSMPSPNNVVTVIEMAGKVYIIFPDGHMAEATPGTTFPYASGYAVETKYDSMALLQTPLKAPDGPLVRLGADSIWAVPIGLSPLPRPISPEGGG